MTDPLMLVVWVDSHMQPQPWNDRSVEPDRTPIKTVGFLLRSDDDWVTLYQSSWEAEDRDVAGVFHIPRSCIRKMIPIATPEV